MKALVGAIFAFAAPLPAAPELVSHSPFDPSQASSAEVIRAEALELRGIMQSADGIRYFIFDKLRNSGTWAAVAEPCGDFTIRSADPAAEEVTLEEGSRSVTIRLRESRVAAQTPEGNSPLHAIAYQPAVRRQPGEPRAPKAANTGVE